MNQKVNADQTKIVLQFSRQSKGRGNSTMFGFGLKIQLVISLDPSVTRQMEVCLTTPLLHACVVKLVDALVQLECIATPHYQNAKKYLKLLGYQLAVHLIIHSPTVKRASVTLKFAHRPSMDLTASHLQVDVVSIKIYSFL